jgi:hypothetical protein
MSTTAKYRLREWFPRWARPDHPIMQRELAHLPSFGIRTEDLYQRPASVIGAMMLWLAPFACGFSGLPWQLLLAPLGWLPLVWATSIIRREVRARTWQTLCSTPYPADEILLAKLAAVIYRLLPPLIMLFFGHILFYGVMLIGWLVSGSAGTIYVYFDGHAIRQGSLIAQRTLPLMSILVLSGIFLILTLIHSLLAVLTNVVISGFVSTMPIETVPLPALSVFIRILLNGAGLIMILSIIGWPARIWHVASNLAYMGVPGWVLPTLLPEDPALALLAGAITVILQAILLLVALQIGLRRVRHLAAP